MSSSITIKMGDLETTLENMISSLSAESIEKMKKSAAKAARYGTSKVKEEANNVKVGTGKYAHEGLIKTGKYAKSWQSKKVNETAISIEYNVYSKKYYMLTHLLEFGHEKVLWGKRMAGQRVRGYPHIEPAERATANEFQKYVLTEMERYDSF